MFSIQSIDFDTFAPVEMFITMSDLLNFERDEKDFLLSTDLNVDA